MFIACQNGHLSVCKWLLEVNAAVDIRKVMNNGVTHVDRLRPRATCRSVPD